MSFELPNKVQANESAGPRWSGAAVLVESMLLLVFLIASLAVFVQMFSVALTRADESAQLTAAVAAASDTAEQFAAYPTQADGQHAVDDLLVVCDVQREPHESGTLYKAEISVYEAAADAGADGAASADAGDASAEHGELVYSVNTSRFVSEVM